MEVIRLVCTESDLGPTVAARQRLALALAVYRFEPRGYDLSAQVSLRLRPPSFRVLLRHWRYIRDRSAEPILRKGRVPLDTRQDHER